MCKRAGIELDDFEALFGGAEFPDGTFMIDYEDEIIEFQKYERNHNSSDHCKHCNDYLCFVNYELH